MQCVVNLENGMPLDELAAEAKAWCKSLDCDCKTVSEILDQKPIKLYDSIQQGIERVNAKAVSAAQKVQKFRILPRDFSVLTGELGKYLFCISIAVRVVLVNCTVAVSKRLMTSAGLQKKHSEWSNAGVILLTYQYRTARYFTVY